MHYTLCVGRIASTKLRECVGRICGSFKMNPVISDRLQQFLADEGISQTELAERVGVAQGTVSRWVRGDIIPSRAKLRILAELMGETPEEAGAWAITSSSTTERIASLERAVADLRRRLDSLERSQ